MKTFTRYFILQVVLTVAVTLNAAAQLPWLEDFSGLGDGTEQDNGATAWSIDYSGRGHFNVQDNRLEAYYMDGIGEWISEPIDISSVNYAEITMDISWFGGGGFSNDDIMRVYYRLDGGPEVLFYENILTSWISSGGSATLSKVLKGNSVQIIIRSYNDYGCSIFSCSYNRFDNIEVKEVTTFYSRADGNWNNNNTWSAVGFSGPAVDPGIFPTRREGAMVAHNVNLSGNAEAAFLEVESGGAVSLNARSLSMVRGGGVIVDDGGRIVGNTNSTLRIDDALTTDLLINDENGISVGNFVLNSGSGLSFAGSGSVAINRDFLINVDAATIDIDIPVTIGDDLQVDGDDNLFTIGADQAWADLDLDEDTRMIFDGSGDQNLATAAGAVLRDLTVNKPDGRLILNNSVHVAGEMNFINGIVESSETNLLIFNDNATNSGASAGSHVNGPVRKIGNDNFFFPIGKDGFYAPIEISGRQNFDASTQFTAEYFTTAGPNTQSLVNDDFSHVSGIEYWDLERTNDPGNDARCNVRLYFMDEERSQILDPSDLIVAHYDGTAWEDFDSEIVGNSVRTTARVRNFSPFTFGSLNGANPLPVELISFAGELTDAGNLLSWTTASELNNEYFVIEKSANGRDWEAFGEVAGSGTVAHPTSYDFLDAEPFFGVTYYRLKQVDYNGESEYFPAISVANDSAPEFAVETIYPNPTAGNVTIRFTATEAGEVAISVTDMQGKPILVKTSASIAGHNSVDIDLSHLDRGVYIIALRLQDEVAVQKIIKG